MKPFLAAFSDELTKTAIDWGKLNPMNWKRKHAPTAYESDGPKPAASSSGPSGTQPPAMGTIGSQTGQKQQLQREGVQF